MTIVVGTTHWTRTLVSLVSLLTIGADAGRTPATQGSAPRMVLVEGGTFMMGDVFAEGGANETPVHQVTLSPFYLAPFEVTVGEFRTFVSETGYRTSAEAPVDVEAGKKLMERAASEKLTPSERLELKRQRLALGGTGYWDAEKCQWTGYEPNVNWRMPGFEQADANPVVALSAIDAMSYCNWLSKKAGLPVAYDPATWSPLDAQGKPTVDITQVKGFRLPTEAEWEYAARERGRDVRFGNGKNTARSSEINFRANAGSYPYLERGEYRKRTVPVGSFAPNSLGLYDMSGNGWEWTGIAVAAYGSTPQTNPFAIGERHALRGGRWGGDASEARVFHRSFWIMNDRCNNSGFRVARSR